MGRAPVRHAGCRAQYLAEELGISVRIMVDILCRIARYGWVERTQRGWYRITELGWERLERARDEGPRGAEF